MPRNWNSGALNQQRQHATPFKYPCFFSTTLEPSREPLCESLLQALFNSLLKSSLKSLFNSLFNSLRDPYRHALLFAALDCLIFKQCFVVPEFVFEHHDDLLQAAFRWESYQIECRSHLTLYPVDYCSGQVWIVLAAQPYVDY